MIRTRVRIPGDPSQPEAVGEELPPLKLSHRAELSVARLRKRQEICQEAKDLHAQGWSIHAIANHLGRERTTIRKFLKVEGDWQPTPRQPGKSKLDPYREHVLSRWEQGCHNVAVKRDYHGILTEESVYKEGAEHARDQLEVLSFSGSEPGHTGFP